MGTQIGSLLVIIGVYLCIWASQWIMIQPLNSLAIIVNAFIGGLLITIGLFQVKN